MTSFMNGPFFPISRLNVLYVQVELAELPYLRSRLIGDYEIELVSKHDPSVRKGEEYFNSQRAALTR